MKQTCCLQHYTQATKRISQVTQHESRKTKNFQNYLGDVYVRQHVRKGLVFQIKLHMKRRKKIFFKRKVHKEQKKKEKISMKTGVISLCLHIFFGIILFFRLFL